MKRVYASVLTRGGKPIGYKTMLTDESGNIIETHTTYDYRLSLKQGVWVARLREGNIDRIKQQAQKDARDVAKLHCAEYDGCVNITEIAPPTTVATVATVFSLICSLVTFLT